MINSRFLTQKIFASADEILYLKSDSNYCYVYSKKCKILTSYTLKLVSSKLNQKHFFRIHHSYVVNCRFIREIIPGEHQVIMYDGSVIPISHRRKLSFLKFIKFQSSLSTSII